MPTASDRRHRRTLVRQALVRGGLAMLLIELVLAIVGERGLLALRSARRDLDAAEANVAGLRRGNAELAGRVRRLTSDPSAIEEIARRELNLIKPGEIVVIIREHPAQ
jgi:cell division protein FtsB